MGSRPRKDGIINAVALGIYISVPFCKTKCSYCNFASDVFSRAVFQRYVDRVCADLKNAPQIAETMGIGYGTVRAKLRAE